MRTRYDTDQCSYYTYQQCAATANGLGTTSLKLAYAAPGGKPLPIPTTPCSRRSIPQ